MLYMVIENFYEGAAPEIYRRAREEGRMLPASLEYIASWVDLDFRTCYQLIHTEDLALFAMRIENWKDLSAFTIVPVCTSTEAADTL
jgi:hypothetical protein